MFFSVIVGMVLKVGLLYACCLDITALYYHKRAQNADIGRRWVYEFVHPFATEMAGET
jgi:hypothetical protein